MTEVKRRDVFPQQHILDLYAKTQDGKLAITYYPENGEKPYDLTYDMDWTEEIAENLSVECESLVATLNHLAQLHDELQNESKRKELLNDEEMKVWNTFVRLFKPFEVPESVINELYLRSEFDELTDDENELLERHYAWRESDCLERLPYNRCSPINFITSAMQYVLLIKWSAPEAEIKKEAHCLAEEMVLYYCSKKKD